MKNQELKQQAIEAKGLSITDAAKILSINRTTLYRYISQEKIQTFKFNGWNRIKHQEIQNFLKNKTSN